MKTTMNIRKMWHRSGYGPSKSWVLLRPWNAFSKPVCGVGGSNSWTQSSTTELPEPPAPKPVFAVISNRSHDDRIQWYHQHLHHTSLWLGTVCLLFLPPLKTGPLSCRNRNESYCKVIACLKVWGFQSAYCIILTFQCLLGIPLLLSFSPWRFFSN
jgi:hypothetical protein